MDTRTFLTAHGDGGGVVKPDEMTMTRPSSQQNEGRPVIRTTADLQPGEQVLILAREVRTVDTITPRERPGAAGELWLAVTWAEDEPEWIATPDREWYLVTPELREQWVNEDAELLPQRNDDERPAVRVGGALVFAYWDAGVLRVSIDTSDVDDPLFIDVQHGEHACAVLVDLDDGTVHERSRS